MKHFLLIIVLFFFNTTISAQNDNANKKRTGINVITKKVEEIRKSQGNVEHTTKISIKNIFAFDSSEVILYGSYQFIKKGMEYNPQNYPMLIKTINGGKTWLDVSQKNMISTISKVKFIDNNHGWVSWNHGIKGSAFGLFRTLDGGSNWEECELVDRPFEKYLYYDEDWTFYSINDGICILNMSWYKSAEEYEVMITKDGGKTFIKMFSIDEQELSNFKNNVMPKLAPGYRLMQSSPEWTLKEGDQNYILENSSTKIDIQKTH